MLSRPRQLVGDSWLSFSGRESMAPGVPGGVQAAGGEEEVGATKPESAGVPLGPFDPPRRTSEHGGEVVAASARPSEHISRRTGDRKKRNCIKIVRFVPLRDPVPWEYLRACHPAAKACQPAFVIG